MLRLSVVKNSKIYVLSGRSNISPPCLLPPGFSHGDSEQEFEGCIEDLPPRVPEYVG